MSEAAVTRGEDFVEWATPFLDAWPLGKSATPAPAGSTLFDVFSAHVQSQPEKPCLGWRERKDPAASPAAAAELGDFRWLSYAQCGSRVSAIGSGLVALGLAMHGGRAGLISANCPDWVLCEYACFRQGVAVVPIYPCCGRGTIDAIVRSAGLAVVFCHAALINTLLDDLAEQATHGDSPVHAIVLIGNGAEPVPLTESSRKTLDSIGASVLSLAELVEAGTANPVPQQPPTPEDVFSIVFTSGSEGQPKGVVITHANALAEIEMLSAFPPFRGPVNDWTYYSYLPLAHVFERSISGLMLRNGASLGFSSGLANLVADMGLLEPHFIIGVPRVWKRIYDTVTGTVAKLPALKRTIFNLAVSRKVASTRTGSAPWFNWPDTVLHSVSSKLGRRLRFVINGAAAADPTLSAWFQAVFGVEFFQGYGLSETFAAVAVQHQGCDKDKAAIGPPVAGTTFRLASVPEMNYLVTDSPPRGEIWVRGPQIARGYLDNPEATAASFRPDGFFMTGDIGQLNTDGTLTIIDRRKNLFKLAQGEYVALEYVETVYGRCDAVAQVWVWAEMMSSFLVAVVVPNIDVVRAQMAGETLPADAAAFCADARVRRHVLGRMDEVATDAKMLGFQRVKAVLLEPAPWSIEANLLTPTFKLRRKELEKKYQTQLAQLCTALQSAKPPPSSKS